MGEKRIKSLFFPNGFDHPFYVQRLQVAKTAVNHLLRLSRGSGGKIISFKQHHRKAIKCSSIGHGSTIYPATDNSEIKRGVIAMKSKSFQNN